MGNFRKTAVLASILTVLSLPRFSSADHIAIVYCAPKDNGEIVVTAIDSSPLPQSPTRASKGRSCSQVIHEMMQRRYEMTSEARPIVAAGPVVFIFKHHK